MRKIFINPRFNNYGVFLSNTKLGTFLLNAKSI